jgi:hypothetical protein
MRPAHERPNVPAMISIAAGNETMTTQAHARSLSPDVTALLPEPAIKYASAAPTVMSRKKTAASAALEPVAAAPQPPFFPLQTVASWVNEGAMMPLMDPRGAPLVAELGSRPP